MCFLNKSEFRELHSSLNLAWRICPLREPALLTLGGAFKFLFSLYLKDATEGALHISCGRSFHARIDEGKNEFRKRLEWAL